jgi:hypothetical protein
MRIIKVVILMFVVGLIGCSTGGGNYLKSPCPPIEYTMMGGSMVPTRTYYSTIEKRKCETYLRSIEVEAKQYRLQQEMRKYNERREANGNGI